MKKLIFVLAIVIPQICLGSGKLQMEPGYFFGAESFGVKAGVAIDEHLFGKLHYAQWTGLGYAPQLPNTRMMWATSSHDLVNYFKTWSMGVGAAVSYGDENFGDGFNKLDYNVHLKFGYQLW